MIDIVDMMVLLTSANVHSREEGHDRCRGRSKMSKISNSSTEMCPIKIVLVSTHHTPHRCFDYSVVLQKRIPSSLVDTLCFRSGVLFLHMPKDIHNPRSNNNNSKNTHSNSSSACTPSRHSIDKLDHDIHHIIQNWNQLQLLNDETTSTPFIKAKASTYQYFHSRAFKLKEIAPRRRSSSQSRCFIGTLLLLESKDIWFHEYFCCYSHTCSSCFHTWTLMLN